MRLIAQFISILFNPLIFLFVIPYLVILKQTDDMMYALKWQLFTSVFIFSAVVFFFIGKWRGIFSDHDVSKREERPKFYLMILTVSTLYLTASLIFKGIFFSLSIAAFGICVAIVAFAIANYRIKASGHVAVASAFVVTMHILSKATPVWYTFWIVPLVAWARLTLKRHTVYEIVIGGVFGVAVTLGTFLIGKYLYTY